MVILAGCVAGVVAVILPAFLLRKNLFLSTPPRQKVLVDFIDIDEVGYGNEE